jgi:hypothetical protein
MAFVHCHNDIIKQTKHLAIRKNPTAHVCHNTEPIKAF